MFQNMFNNLPDTATYTVPSTRYQTQGPSIPQYTSRQTFSTCLVADDSVELRQLGLHVEAA